jgi:26S proteasome regulatory subunit T1
MSQTETSNFLDGAIRNRISVRLIAEQHLALSQAIKNFEGNPGKKDKYVGVVDMICSPSEMIEACGSFVGELCDATLGVSPSIVIDGQTDATFA